LIVILKIKILPLLPYPHSFEELSFPLDAFAVPGIKKPEQCPVSVG
jgi:hypothetical protein